MSTTRRRYDDLDGFRTLAAFAIVGCHVFANGGYHCSLLGTIVMPFGNFVALFFMISGFGMCCGYYERIKNAEITPAKFYSRRIWKNLPFFAFLVLVDLLMGGSPWEAFADMTLVFNLLPDIDISVIGVGWALGVIFVFYFFFPFFIYLLDNKKRAWFTFFISIGLNLACHIYFLDNGNVGSHRFIFHSLYFVAGGLLFLYREDIEKYARKWHGLFFMIAILSFGLLYVPIPSMYNDIRICFIWVTWIVVAIVNDYSFLANRFTKFISGISLEIYLSHMLIFRIIAILGFTHAFTNEVFSFLLSYLLVLIATVFFSVCAKKILSLLEKSYKKICLIKQ